MKNAVKHDMICDLYGVKQWDALYFQNAKNSVLNHFWIIFINEILLSLHIL